ncbi:hypothetical protein SAY86_030014 [Trapa natans]|uniref:Serine aminopeptidase S33 domain-containing protein n=1 Tax=Trapa natans TaxID=22666 RepID=A0AAN7RHY2_TRANT|nr:hypothetical protein SAY86_030014 [Trapa natans]
MASCFVSPLFGPNWELVRLRHCRVIARSASGGSYSTAGIPPSPALSPVQEKQYLGPAVEARDGSSTTREKLDLQWDDGYGSRNVKDYLDAVKEIIEADGGPPRWFCPAECGHPLEGSPILLFLPGLDGTGMGLILHHKALGRVFEVRCLHIPVQDRTPFEGLVRLVEETARLEHSSSPKKPIYLVGDSFGGCLALAVAARNPTIDLVLILINPTTSFAQSNLQSLMPALEALPVDRHFAVPYLLSFGMCDPIKMAMVNIDNKLPARAQLQQLLGNLTAFLPGLSELADILPKGTLLWRIKLLKSAAAYANSRLHAIRAEVLVLASGRDNMVPSSDQGQQLVKTIHNCKVRHFKDHSHALLMEEGINLLTIIKGTCLYRRSGRRDHILDFLPPSTSEFKAAFEQIMWYKMHTRKLQLLSYFWLLIIWQMIKKNGTYAMLKSNCRPLIYASSPVLYSTLEDGKVVRGLSGVPSNGPVLLVGYHMLLGCELYSLVREFMLEKNIMLRGLALQVLFNGSLENPTSQFLLADWLKVFGALPVTASNLFKLLSTNSHVLLYPGGLDEACHYKGEEYKCKWPNQPEFVRMAARFGATIVPFGTVGEDDLVKHVLDYNDMMKIHFLNNHRVRDHLGEVADEEQPRSFPGILPKIPGRMYYLFGKPVKTHGWETILKSDKECARELYLQIKHEVEHCLDYLLKKRQEDPYRNIFDRMAYHIRHSPPPEIPGFQP